MYRTIGILAWTFICLFTLPALAGPADSSSGSFPDRPIRLMVPFPAGGAVDGLGRLLAKELRSRLGQPVIVENRPGANGNIGTEAVVHAAPDGYTLLLAGNGLATNESLYKKRSFSELGDLVPVAYLGGAPLTATVPANSSIRTLKDVIDRAREDSSAISYASSGVGSSTHLAAEQLAFAAGVQMVHVPYRGTPAAVSDMVAGRIVFAMLDPINATPLLQTGKMRALAVGGDRRSTRLPGIPTFAEVGYPNVEAKVWFGFMAPARTPPGIVALLNTEINKALTSEAVTEGLNRLGIEAKPQSASAFGQYLRTQAETWRAVIERAKIEPGD